jgi:DNA-nicking Smr family endonuclease
MPVYAAHQAPEIGGHREAHLRRGRLEPEARIDLHGLTQDEAYRALIRFFTRARSLDQRVVLVITGKGGVLRDLVPRWFAEHELAPLISGVSSAHVKHGGGGAYYVAVRRKRR